MHLVTVIHAFSKTSHDINARCSFDLLAGGLGWSDECPPIEMYEGLVLEAHRDLIAHRASLTLGTPINDTQPFWDQMLKECPSWPGFRAERRSVELRAELEECLNADF